MTKIGAVYGEALYSLSREEGRDEAIRQQLEVLNRCFGKEPEFLRLLGNPGLTNAERLQIVEDCFRGKVDGNVLNFLKILTEKGCIRYFPGCVQAYRKLYDRDHGILSVSAVTAAPMTAQQAQKLTKTLGRITGKHIALTVTVDPAILGGMRLDFDGKRVDGTVVHRLDTVGKLLKNAAL